MHTVSPNNIQHTTYNIQQNSIIFFDKKKNEVEFYYVTKLLTKTVILKYAQNQQKSIEYVAF